MIRSAWSKLLPIAVLGAAVALWAVRRGEARLPAPPSPSPPVAASVEREEEPLGPIRFPDVVLTNQRGEPVHLYRDLIQGRLAVMSFIFTRCTTICPPIGVSMSRLQKQLGARAGKDVSLVSVTIDPTNDTPDRLLEWGKRFDAGPGWTLLTGAAPDIDRLLKALTVYTAAKEDHAPILLVGNDVSGDWVRAYGLSSPTTLLTTLSRIQGRAPAGGGALAPPPAAEPPPEDPSPAATTMPMAAGEAAAHAYFTDVVLTNQDGKDMRLYTDLLRGKTVILNVFFASCGGACPVMARTFGKVQAHLGDRLGKDVILISLSVDPEKDTPAKLKEYAARQGAKPGWYFLTGKRDNVDLALRKLGQYVKEPSDHSSVLIVGNDRTGLWKKAFGLANADEVIKVVDSVVDDRGAPSPSPR